MRRACSSAGTGTGILAIAALALGSTSAIGFDIDPWAADNAPENAALNDCADRFEVRIGDIGVVPEKGFDVVIANIQRHIILPMLNELDARLAPSGTLMLAGILSAEAHRKGCPFRARTIRRARGERRGVVGVRGSASLNRVDRTRGPNSCKPLTRRDAP